MLVQSPNHWSWHHFNSISYTHICNLVQFLLGLPEQANKMSFIAICWTLKMLFLHIYSICIVSNTWHILDMHQCGSYSICWSGLQELALQGIRITHTKDPAIGYFHDNVHNSQSSVCSNLIHRFLASRSKLRLLPLLPRRAPYHVNHLRG